MLEIDHQGHGTAVISLVAALAPDAKIISIKCINRAFQVGGRQAGAKHTGPGPGWACSACRFGSATTRCVRHLISTGYLSPESSYAAAAVAIALKA